MTSVQLRASTYVPVVVVLVLGAVAGMGFGDLALLGLVGVLAAGVLLWRVEPRFYGTLVMGVLLVAPWQQLPLMRSTVVLFPVLWLALALLLVTAMRGKLDSAAQAQAFLGAVVIAWAMVGSALGSGASNHVIKWIALWGAGVAVFLLLNVAGARRLLLSAAPAVGLIFSSYVLVEWLLRRNPLYSNVVSLWVESGFLATSTFRPTGLTGHPLTVADTAGFLALLTLVALRAGLVRPRLALTSLGVTAAAIVLSGARGALIVTGIAAVLVVTVSSEAFGRRLKYVLGAAVTALIGWHFFGDLLLKRFGGLAESTSLHQRLASFAAAKSVAQSSPLFGRGAGYGALALADLGYSVINYESEWAGLVIGIGIVGAILVLSIPLLSVPKALKREWRGPARDLAIASAVYAIGIIGTHNMFEWWGGMILFWACVAFTVPNAEVRDIGADSDA